jgi:hypothetical protein
MDVGHRPAECVLRDQQSENDPMKALGERTITGPRLDLRHVCHLGCCEEPDQKSCVTIGFNPRASIIGIGLEQNARGRTEL